MREAIGAVAQRRRGGGKRQSLNEHEARVVHADMWAESVARIGTEIAKWSGIGFCAYRASLVLMDWSGKTTAADVTLAFTPRGVSGVVLILSVLVAITAFLYGKYQSRLRRDTVLHLESRVKHLERTVDPRRSSSGLTPSGGTPEEGRS